MYKLNVNNLVVGPLSTNTYVVTVTGGSKEADGEISKGAKLPGLGARLFGKMLGPKNKEKADEMTGKCVGAEPSGNENGTKLPVTGCFIVDPGSNAPTIIQELGDCTPTAILLTHGHFDHLMAVNELRSHYPDIKVYAHPEDGEVMLHPGKNIVRMEFKANAVSDFVPVRDGQKLRIGGVNIEVIHTPGHSKGSVCYYLENDRLLFSGDTLFKESYGRTDFEHGDYDELKDSIVNRLFVRLKDAGHVDIKPGHMDATTLEHELECNPILG